MKTSNQNPFSEILENLYAEPIRGRKEVGLPVYGNWNIRLENIHQANPDTS